MQAGDVAFGPQLLQKADFTLNGQVRLRGSLDATPRHDAAPWLPGCTYLCVCGCWQATGGFTYEYTQSRSSSVATDRSVDQSCEDR